MDIPLFIPLGRKDLAQQLGARWDADERMWMWPNDRQRAPVRKWLPYSYRNDIEPPYILPEMIPQSMWGVNLRNLLSQAEWDRIRKDCYKKARYHCRVCGAKGEPPHCNEQWRFESGPEPSREGLQKLVRLACLCRAC